MIDILDTYTLRMNLSDHLFRSEMEGRCFPIVMNFFLCLLRVRLRIGS